GPDPRSAGPAISGHSNPTRKNHVIKREGAQARADRFHAELSLEQHGAVDPDRQAGVQVRRPDHAGRHAAEGNSSAAGAFLNGNAVYNIAKGGFAITLA